MYVHFVVILSAQVSYDYLPKCYKDLVYIQNVYFIWISGAILLHVSRLPKPIITTVICSNLYHVLTQQYVFH